MENPPNSSVEFWQRDLVANGDEIEVFWSFLSQSEQEKAIRFYRPRDVERYIVGRGWMRQVLAGYLDIEPVDISFTENEFGKPRLEDGADLHFNLTHSHGYAVLVAATGFEVGADIELLRPYPVGLAETFFSKAECAELARLPETDRDEGFFACWTRKEAFVKALGEGLSFPLGDFSVSLAPGKPAMVEHIRGAAAEANNWQMVSFRPAPPFIGAVAARKRGWKLLPGARLAETGRDRRSAS